MHSTSTPGVFNTFNSNISPSDFQRLPSPRTKVDRGVIREVSEKFAAFPGQPDRDRNNGSVIIGPLEPGCRGTQIAYAFAEAKASCLVCLTAASLPGFAGNRCSGSQTLILIFSIPGYSFLRSCHTLIDVIPHQ